VLAILLSYIIFSSSSEQSASTKLANGYNMVMAVLLLVFGWITFQYMIPTYTPARLADEALNLSNHGVYDQAYNTIDSIRAYQGKTPYFYGLIRRHSQITEGYALTLLGTDNEKYQEVIHNGLDLLDIVEKIEPRDYLM